MRGHGGNIFKYGMDLLDFSSNINPFGLPDEVKQSIINNVTSFNLYPDPACKKLSASIASFHSLDPADIVCGNGAADLIYRLTLVLKPKKALLLAPTFSEYEDALRSVDCYIDYYMLDEASNFTLDHRIIKSIHHDTDVIFICNPNNPTGMATDKNLLKDILLECKRKDVTLIMDECFMDFLNEPSNFSLLEYVKEFTNLVIIKAFTKIYAMAGIRLGYFISSNYQLNDNVRHMLQSWSVSSVATVAGIAALGAKEYVMKSKTTISANRKNFINSLNSLSGIKVYNTHNEVNYIFFKTDLIDLFNKMLAKGILIRSCANYKGLNKSFYRVAVRLQEENDYFIRRLAEVISEV